MRFDFEDVLAGEFGRVLYLVLFLFSTALMGSIIGGLAWFIGNWDLSPGYLVAVMPALLASPALLMSDWLFLNVGLLVLALTILFVTDYSGYAAWGILVGFESIFALLGTPYRHEPASVLVVASLSWVVLLGMAETGIWLIRHMRLNRLARDLAELGIENSMRRAEIAAEDQENIRREEIS